jgi:hypothetical protein
VLPPAQIRTEIGVDLAPSQELSNDGETSHHLPLSTTNLVEQGDHLHWCHSHPHSTSSTHVTLSTLKPSHSHRECSLSTQQRASATPHIAHRAGGRDLL